MRFACMPVVGLAITLLLCLNVLLMASETRIDPRAYSPPVTSIAVDDDRGLLIQGSQAGLVVRATSDLSEIRRLSTQLEHIHDIAMAPDKSHFAAVGGSPNETGIIEIYRWPSGELLKTLKEHEDTVYSVSWRTDSQRFVAASADHLVKEFDRKSWACVHVYEGHSRPVLAAEYLNGGQNIITAGVDESLRLWGEPLRNEKATPLRTLTQHTRPVYDLAVRPIQNGELPQVVSVGEDRTVRWWQPTIGRMVRFVKIESTPLAVCWTTDGLYVVAACKDGIVRTIDATTNEVKQEHVVDEGPAYCIECTRQGELFVGGANGVLKKIALSR